MAYTALFDACVLYLAPVTDLVIWSAPLFANSGAASSDRLALRTSIWQCSSGKECRPLPQRLEHARTSCDAHTPRLPLTSPATPPALPPLQR